MQDRMEMLKQIARQITPSEAGYILQMCRKRFVKKCKECGIEFVGTNQQVFCSFRCKARYTQRLLYRKKKAKEKGTPNEGKLGVPLD